MSRKISIELTSDKGDGTWTWRAAGAREPKGLVAATMLPAGAAVNAVFAAEVETYLGDVTILSVAEITDVRDSRPQAETIEVVGTKTHKPGVSATYAKGKKKGKGSRRGRDSDGGFGRDDFGGGFDRSGFDRRGQGRGKGGGRGGQQGQKKWQKLAPGKQHETAWFESLPPEEAVIAEQLQAGGMAAVKAALAKQNKQDGAGAPETPNEAFLKLAERLQAESRAAHWHDRIDAVLRDFNQLSLGDIRSVVAMADTHAIPQEAKAKAEEAKQKLDQRVDIEHTQWLADVAMHVSEGRLHKALRLSGLPPKVGVQLPADLALLLTEATNEALDDEATSDDWLDVLEVLAYSPVRRLVRPAALPAKITPRLKKNLARFAKRVPHVGQLVEAAGISLKPPKEAAPAAEAAPPAEAPSEKAPPAEAAAEEPVAEAMAETPAKEPVAETSPTEASSQVAV